MPIRPGTIQKIGWRTSGTADAFVEATAALLDIPTVEIGDDEVSTALYLNRAAANRKNFTIPVHDFSLFTALNTKQVARDQLELVITLTNGDVLTYDPVSFTASPRVGQVPHIGEAWVAATGTVTNPPDVAWTSVGSIQAGSTLDIQAVSAQDGYNLPFYKHMRLNHEMVLFSDAVTDPATTLATFENALLAVALEHPDGTFTKYANVYSETRNAPDFSEEGFVGLRWRVQGVQDNITNLITFDVGAPDYVFGFVIEGAAFGYTEANILTIT